MSDKLEVQRRRALYRACHRGTKEMDVLIGRFAAARIGDYDDAALSRFERFLALPDPALQSWIFSGEPGTDREFADLVAEIRTFHGLSRDGRD